MCSAGVGTAQRTEPRACLALLTAAHGQGVCPCALQDSRAGPFLGAAQQLLRFGFWSRSSSQGLEHQGKQEWFPHRAGSDPPPGPRAGYFPVCSFPPAQELHWEAASVGSMSCGFWSELLELIPPSCWHSPSLLLPESLPRVCNTTKGCPWPCKTNLETCGGVFGENVAALGHPWSLGAASLCLIHVCPSFFLCRNSTSSKHSPVCPAE